MATIEPRLINMLNDAGPQHTESVDLPPIQKLSFPDHSHLRSLPSLDLDGAPRGDVSLAKHPLPPTHMPSISAITSDDTTLRPILVEGHFGDDGATRHQKSHHLEMILDNTDVADDLSTKKRHRAMTTTEDMIQLKPLKKQRSCQQVLPRQQVVPPIISGLIEPPPNAAVLPPMATVDFDDDSTRNIASLKDFGTIIHDVAAPVTGESEKANAAKIKRKAAKPRRKWSEQETNNLLLGVSRHGVGKWTNILEDPEFRFDDRTAGDLKDRFRTCCPDELRDQLSSKRAFPKRSSVTSSETKAKIKSSLLRENLLIESEELEQTWHPPSASQDADADATPKPRKSRAHRKKMEDLASLGIQGPFKKSHRRERRPFTEQDDKEILQGLYQYGPAWTKIQRDPRFNLSSRQPTDLRDRVRNKYPDIYNTIEKGTADVKEAARGSSLMEPSVNITIENSLTSSKIGSRDATSNRTSSKDNMPMWPLPTGRLESLDTHAAESVEPSGPQLLGGVGGMDISRLLLYDDSNSADT
jgi:hypothetical protein